MVLHCVIIANDLSEMWPGHVFWDQHVKHLHIHREDKQKDQLLFYIMRLSI